MRINPLPHALILLSVFFTTCDTSSNVKPRSDKFFIKYFGQDGDQYASNLISTSDGGYIIIGSTDPNKSIASGAEASGDGDEDIIIVKTDAEGNDVWTQVFDSGNSNIDEGTAIIETATGYVAVGNTYNGTDWDVVVLDLDVSGNLASGIYLFGEIKEKIISTDPDVPGDETARGITILNDGTNNFFMIAGSTTAAISELVVGTDQRDYYALKLDALFAEDTTWAKNNKIMGRDEPDYGLKMYDKVNDPSRQVMLGYVDGPVEPGFGDNTFSSWQYIGTSNGADDYYGDINSQVCEDVALTVDGYLMVGTLEGSTNQLYYASLNGLTAVESKAIFTTITEELEGRSIIRSIDGANLYLGQIIYLSGDKDIFLAKTSITGNEHWSRTFGSDGLDDGAKLIQNADGSIVFAGTMNISGQRKISLIKTNADGELKL